VIGHEDFWHPGQLGHATHPEHSLTLDGSSGSLAGGQPHFVVLAGSAGLRHRSVGLSFGMVTIPVTLGRPPRRSSTSFFLILSLRTAAKYMLIYIYIDTYT
jgi:hypothetical protein